MTAVCPLAKISNNEWLHCFEADIVVRYQSGALGIGSKLKEVVINVEVDGPSHKKSGSKKRFDDERDDCLKRKQGVQVYRIDLTSPGGWEQFYPALWERVKTTLSSG